MAIDDQPRAARSDLSRNKNPAYWCKKLQNTYAILEECKCRGMGTEELWRLPDKQATNMFISHYKTTVVIHK
ncbi:MAG: hypothetical protein ACKPKO_07320 [Candidatus Fonsibacter sp.]